MPNNFWQSIHHCPLYLTRTTQVGTRVCKVVHDQIVERNMKILGLGFLLVGIIFSNSAFADATSCSELFKKQKFSPVYDFNSVKPMTVTSGAYQLHLEAVVNFLSTLSGKYKSEIAEILASGRATQEELESGSVLETKTENNETVYLLSITNIDANKSKNNNRVFYFTETPGLIEKGNVKGWGELSMLSHNLKAKSDGGLKLKSVIDGKNLVVEDGVVRISNLNGENGNLLLMLKNIIADSNTSSFRRTFIEKYEADIKNLMQKKVFKEENLDEIIFNLDIAENVEGNMYYVLPTKDKGPLYFKIDSHGFGFMKDLPKTMSGNSYSSVDGQAVERAYPVGYLSPKLEDQVSNMYYTANGEMISIARAFGFTGQSEARVIKSTDGPMSNRAFMHKIEMALGIKLNDNQVYALNHFQTKRAEIERAHGSTIKLSMSIEQWTGFAASQKKVLVFRKNFTEEQADEIIKVLF